MTDVLDDCHRLVTWSPTSTLHWSHAVSVWTRDPHKFLVYLHLSLLTLTWGVLKMGFSRVDLWKMINSRDWHAEVVCIIMLNSWMNTHTGQFPKMWACGMGMMTKNDKDPALINNVNLRLEGLVHRVRISNARVFFWLLSPWGTPLRCSALGLVMSKRFQRDETFLES